MDALKKEEDVVTFLYRVILKRDPDPEGLARYAEGLRKNEFTVMELARILYLSEENAKKRELFRQASSLALADFLNQIKGSVVYSEIRRAVEDKLFQQDLYDLNSLDIKIEDNGSKKLIVTNTPVAVPPNSVVYTTSKEVAAVMPNTIPTIEGEYESCYVLTPEQFDALGILIRKLDRVCQKIFVTTLTTYCKLRSNKVSRFSGEFR